MLSYRVTITLYVQLIYQAWKQLLQEPRHPRSRHSYDFERCTLDLRESLESVKQQLRSEDSSQFNTVTTKDKDNACVALWTYLLASTWVPAMPLSLASPGLLFCFRLLWATSLFHQGSVYHWAWSESLWH